MRGDLGERFDEPDDRKRLHAVEYLGARCLEQRAAECFEVDPGEAAPQGRRDGGGVRVP